MKSTETFLDQQRQNQTKNQAIAHHDRGNQLYTEGKYKDAIEEFTTAISLQLSNVLYYFERARCYFVERDYHKYVFDLSLAMHVEASNYALYVARSYGLFLLGQYENARLDLISARTLFDDYQAKEKAEAALAAANGTTRRGPGHSRSSGNVVIATIAFRRGTVNFALNKFQEAIADFTECISLQENFGPAYSRRGAAYLILKRVNEAIEDLKIACSKCNTNQHIHHYRLGQAYLQAGQNQQAVDQFTAAIDSAASVVQQLSGKRGKVQAPTKPPTEALFFTGARFDVFKFEPPDVLKLNDTTQNFRDQQRTVFPEFSATRGKAKALLGKFQEALEDFQLSAQLDQNNAETYFEKCTANRIMGNYRQALEDCEICATIMLNSNVAYNKAIILENSGEIDAALRIYEAILQGVFRQSFTTDYLRSKGTNVIDAVIREAEQSQGATGGQFGGGRLGFIKIVDPHPPSLYHAALLHRQKLNFERALQLTAAAIEENPEDERLLDLQAMLYCDSHQYDEAIASATKSIELQINQPKGVFWDSYFVRAVCFFRKQMYNHCLEDVVRAQNRPGGGLEKQMKRADQEKIVALLLKLPPGSPISIAYMNFKNIDAIPKDPLAPSSAARGLGAGQAVGSAHVFPILDLRGCLPGFHNHDVIWLKAQSLFQLQDYVGCVRAITLALEDFDHADTAKGLRNVNLMVDLVRNNKPIRFDYQQAMAQQKAEQARIEAMKAQEKKMKMAETGVEDSDSGALLSSEKDDQNTTEQTEAIDGAAALQMQPQDDQIVREQVIDQQTIDALLTPMKVKMNKGERDQVYELYFLRARALAMLNRFQHALKDCLRAKAIFEFRDSNSQNGMESSVDEVATIGNGSLLFFGAKLYAYLRLYNKSYHFARAAVRAGLPYNFIHRAHYLMGVALVYTQRLELAVKCFTLAMRSKFQALVSEYAYEHQENQKGLIQMLSLEEIAAYIEQHDQVVEDLKIQMLQQPKLNSQVANFNAQAVKAEGDIHRVQAPKSFPSDSEVAKNKQLEQVRLQLLSQVYAESKLAQITFDNEPVMDLEKIQAKRLKSAGQKVATQKVGGSTFSTGATELHSRLTTLQQISTPLTWVDRETVFYLHERAKCLQELGKHEEAVRDFTTALQFQPLNDRLYFRRGFSFKATGLFEEAVIDFDKARELRPDLQIYQISYAKVGSIPFTSLVPPGNEEFYTGVDGDEFRHVQNVQYSKFYDDAKAPIKNVVDKRHTNPLGVVGVEDNDVWEILASFGEVEVEV